MSKTNGFILAIDQASNCAGVALFKDNVLHAHTTLNSISPKDPYGRRLAEQVRQLEAFLDTQIGDEKINVLLFEGVRSSYVLTTVGAFCCARQLQDCKFSPKHSFVGALSWKKWAQLRGATGKFKDIKGVKGLSETGFPVAAYGITSDDICDAIMIYFCYRDRK